MYIICYNIFTYLLRIIHIIPVLQWMTFTISSIDFHTGEFKRAIEVRFPFLENGTLTRLFPNVTYYCYSFWLPKTGLVYPRGIVLRDKTVDWIWLLLVKGHSGWCRTRCPIHVLAHTEQSGNYCSPLSGAGTVLHEQTLGGLWREQVLKLFGNALVFFKETWENWFK